MNKCVYTGSRCFLKGPDVAVAADIYDQGSVVVVRYNPMSISHLTDSITECTHIADLRYDSSWNHQTAGVAVVNKSHFEGEFR
jgi:hypothetical protein